MVDPRSGLAGTGMLDHVSVLFRRVTVACDMMEKFAPCQPERRLVGTAEPGRQLDQRFEHDLQIERRAADDLEHVGSRRLLFQRFGEIVGALTQFVEQPRVLDGDDGLGGEVLHQLDLPVGEGSDFLAVDG